MFCSFANLYNNTSKETITHLWFSICLPHMGFPCSLVSKESTYNAGAKGSILGWERTPGEGNGNILQYSCLENPMNREAWWATVHGVARVEHNLATKPLPHPLYKYYAFSSVQSLSHVRLFVTPWIAAHQAFLSITNSQSSLKLMSIESVMPSSHLILCHLLLLLPPIPPSIRVFSNESTLRMKWPKYWSFSFSISPSNEHPGLISFRMNWLDLLAVQGTLKSLLQHHTSKASILSCSAFFTVQLTSIHDHWKNHSLD